MKKAFACLLCLLLTISLAVPIFSYENEDGLGYCKVNGWVISSGETKISNLTFNLINGDTVAISICFDNAASDGGVKVGVINRDTNYRMFMTVTDTNVHTVNLHILAGGTYSFYIENNSTQKLTVVDGTYEVFEVGGVIPSMAVDLNVPLYHQEQTKWCWASCIQMCGAYLTNKKVSQSDIVIAAKGSVVNEGGVSSDYKKGVSYATNSAYSAERYLYAYSTANLMSMLKNNTPVIIGFVYPNGNGHANVLRGMSADQVFIKVNDPAASITGATDGMVKYYRYEDLTFDVSYRKYSSTVVISKVS